MNNPNGTCERCGRGHEGPWCPDCSPDNYVKWQREATGSRNPRWMREAEEHEQRRRNDLLLGVR